MNSTFTMEVFPISKETVRFWQKPWKSLVLPQLISSDQFIFQYQAAVA